MRIVDGVAFIVAASVAVVAQAEETKVKDDPNRVICEKQEILGTRLASKRVCKTKAEWAEERRENRQAIDRAQTIKQQPPQ